MTKADFSVKELLAYRIADPRSKYSGQQVITLILSSRKGYQCWKDFYERNFKDKEPNHKNRLHSLLELVFGNLLTKMSVIAICPLCERPATIFHVKDYGGWFASVKPDSNFRHIFCCQDGACRHEFNYFTGSAKHHALSFDKIMTLQSKHWNHKYLDEESAKYLLHKAFGMPLKLTDEVAVDFLLEKYRELPAKTKKRIGLTDSNENDVQAI